MKDFHRAHHAEAPPGSPNTDGEKDHVQPEDFKHRIIFMSMYNDIHWGQKGNQESCKRNSSDIAEHAEKFPRRHWSFLGPGSEEKWYATLAHQPDGLWNKVAQELWITVAESVHPVFRGACASSRGPLKSKGCWENIDTLQRGTYDCRASTTHHCLRQSAHCLRIRSGLVPGSCSATQKLTLHLAPGHPM